MKIGIMQPYFLPYIGYWQLMNAVDKYVIYDDVNYINRGWINRNRILVNGQVKYFNVPMLGASQNKLINQIKVDNDSKVFEKNLRMLESAYKKAPYYEIAFPVIKRIMELRQANLALYLKETFHLICEYLGIDTTLVLSSELEKDCHLKGQDKILSICELLGASEYYNAINGQTLYNSELFLKRGIKLKFVKTLSFEYPQFSNVFEANLSIIDMMMFCSKEKIQQYLVMYTVL